MNYIFLLLTAKIFIINTDGVKVLNPIPAGSTGDEMQNSESRGLLFLMKVFIKIGLFLCLVVSTEAKTQSNQSPQSNPASASPSASVFYHLHKLPKEYNPSIKPGPPGHVINVSVTVNLRNIETIVESENRILMSTYAYLEWYDPVLKWKSTMITTKQDDNETETIENEDCMTLDVSKLWIPDIQLIDSVIWQRYLIIIYLIIISIKNLMET